VGGAQTKKAEAEMQPWPLAGRDARFFSVQNTKNGEKLTKRP
jgi:hypothetical protein